MKTRIILPLLAAGTLLASALPGQAAATRSDATATTIEPILVKSDAQVSMAPFRTNAIPESNITKFTLTAEDSATPGTGGGHITASITTAAPMPRTPLEAATMAPPYGGVHVMVMFQADSQEEAAITGCSLPRSTAGPCPDGSTTNPPEKWFPAWKGDRQFYALSYGVTANESDNDSWLGVYDPSGRIGVRAAGVSGVVPVGQLWSIQGQRTQACSGTPAEDQGDLPANRGNNTAVSFSTTAVANDTVNIKIPYLYKWRTRAPLCFGRSKQIVSDGEVLSNAVAFSWTDHEIGGPEPVGLILGWTWYTDSIPGVLGAPGTSATNFGYKVGTPSGDPNVAAIPTHTCAVYVRGVQQNPLYQPGACMVANPVGPGFALTGLNTVAQ